MFFRLLVVGSGLRLPIDGDAVETGSTGGQNLEVHSNPVTSCDFYWKRRGQQKKVKPLEEGRGKKTPKRDNFLSVPGAGREESIRNYNFSQKLGGREHSPGLA